MNNQLPGLFQAPPRSTGLGDVANANVIAAAGGAYVAGAVGLVGGGVAGYLLGRPKHPIVGIILGAIGGSTVGGAVGAVMLTQAAAQKAAQQP